MVKEASGLGKWLRQRPFFLLLCFSFFSFHRRGGGAPGTWEAGYFTPGDSGICSLPIILEHSCSVLRLTHRAAGQDTGSRPTSGWPSRLGPGWAISWGVCVLYTFLLELRRWLQEQRGPIDLVLAFFSARNPSPFSEVSCVLTPSPLVILDADQRYSSGSVLGERAGLWRPQTWGKTPCVTLTVLTGPHLQPGDVASLHRTHTSAPCGGVWYDFRWPSGPGQVSLLSGGLLLTLVLLNFHSLRLPAGVALPHSWRRYLIPHGHKPVPQQEEVVGTCEFVLVIRDRHVSSSSPLERSEASSGRG